MGRENGDRAWYHGSLCNIRIPAKGLGVGAACFGRAPVLQSSGGAGNEEGRWGHRSAHVSLPCLCSGHMWSWVCSWWAQAQTSPVSSRCVPATQQLFLPGLREGLECCAAWVKLNSLWSDLCPYMFSLGLFMFSTGSDMSARVLC